MIPVVTELQPMTSENAKTAGMPQSLLVGFPSIIIFPAFRTWNSSPLAIGDGAILARTAFLGPQSAMSSSEIQPLTSSWHKT